MKGRVSGPQCGDKKGDLAYHQRGSRMGVEGRGLPLLFYNSLMCGVVPSLKDPPTHFCFLIKKVPALLKVLDHGMIQSGVSLTVEDGEILQQDSWRAT